ncbi:bacterial translation initiation factor 3 (bIF-3) [Thermaerobacter marianensis DSM 12885]|uniref:Translation initiation factor IF-3 n=1 Tax=Thermaerobacter marianensis (strain ATCC 700841 / DSM 12885 / JCM 10246 / 7p75a) TaxID=644966 RepID=E6SIU6_THEM7|nr:translation initiation factor IF-3 [Thermaerobacter marianensis]ADU50941.1 bacterial translation initiation factor 3 (bIF-3) [Thermaerobacter marianensis DSM 12885]
MNEQIRVREVRVISPEGEQLGIFPTHEALRMAYERNLDLVEVAPQARPPVCRIMDYGKYKYEQAKRDREARRRQKIVDIKEVKMRPRIDQHDFEVKLRNARRFLEDGDKVKATIMFRGREIVHADLGRQVLERLAKAVEDIATVERRPVVEGRNMTMVLAPRPQAAARPEPRPEARPAAQEAGNAAAPAGGEPRST